MRPAGHAGRGQSHLQRSQGRRGHHRHETAVTCPRGGWGRCLVTHPGMEMKAKEATRLRIQGTLPGSSRHLLVAWEAPKSPRSPWPPGRPGNRAMLAATDGMGSGRSPSRGRGLNPAWSLCSLLGGRALPSPPPHSSLHCSVAAIALQQAVSLFPRAPAPSAQKPSRSCSACLRTRVPPRFPSIL